MWCSSGYRGERGRRDRDRGDATNMMAAHETRICAQEPPVVEETRGALTPRPLSRSPSPSRSMRETSKMTTRMRRAQPHAKTSSERGRRFRARQREREAWLVKYVLQVGEEIQSLSRSRQLQYEQSLRTRHSAEGSCVRAIREFFSLFRDGLESDEIPANQPFLAEHVRFKERYMRYVYDPDTITGDLRGVDAAIDQWRRYTVVHDRFHLDLGHIETLGPLDDPTFHLHHKLTVRISRATFQHMFPSCVDDEELVSKFLHRLVTYDSVAYFRFSDEGRINYYGVQVDFVNGLMRAGGSLRDVSSMLQCAMITPLCTIRDGGQCRQESAVIESE